MNARTLTGLLGVLLSGALVSAAEPPGVAARGGYEAALQKDGHAFEEQWRDLNRRFKTSLEKLHVGARDRGDLDETLAAKQLWSRVQPLVTGTIFGAASPPAGRVPCPLPDAPESKGLTAQAYTNYVAKAAALANQFNAVVSNRHARYVSGLDEAIRARTKAGEIDAAILLREQRMAAAAAGPPRLAFAGSSAAASSPQAGSFSGRWRAAISSAPLREFRPDGTAAYLGADGGLLWRGPYRMIDAKTVQVVTPDGWEDTYRMQSDGAFEVAGLNRLDGRRSNYRATPEAATGAANAFLGRWQTESATPWREFRPDGQVDYLDAEQRRLHASPYQVQDATTAVVVTPSGWQDIYRLRSATEGEVDARPLAGGASRTYRFRREGVVAGGHPILGTWCDTWDAAYPGQTRVFDPQGVFRAVRSNGVEYASGSYKLTGPDTAEFVWPDRTITRYRVLSDGRLQLRRLQSDGTEQVLYGTRPGIVQAMTVWAPGEEAKGTWAKEWLFEGRGVQTGVAKLKDVYSGRERVWETHPVNAAVPAKWIRSVLLAAGKPHALRLDVCAGRGSDFELSILVNGDEVLKRVIAGDTWQPIEINLNRYAGQRVKVELRNGGGGNPRWAHEYAYWDKVVLE